MQHIFKLYDDTNNMFYDYKSLKTNAGDNRRNDVKQNDVFYVILNDDYKIIKIELILSLIDDVNNNTVDCKIYNTYNSNFLSVKYYKKINLISINNNLGDLENTILSNSSKIDTNKKDISTNLIKINSNEDDMLYNLNEINYLKNNKSTQYLKNVYNILFYDEKEQIDFRKDSFYEKVFDINANKNDFIEINLRILLDYENINEAHLIFTAFKLIDDNDDELYVATHYNKDDILYKNFVFISKTIFYNFEKDAKKLKILIYFRKTDINAIIKMWYKPVNTDRMIIKHFGN